MWGHRVQRASTEDEDTPRGEAEKGEAEAELELSVAQQHVFVCKHNGFDYAETELPAKPDLRVWLLLIDV